MLKRLLLIICLITFALIGKSQNFVDWRYHDRYFSVFAGTGWTGYVGDLTNGKPLSSGLSHFNLGVEARLYSKIAARAQIATYRIEGSDTNAADSSYNQQRNLSFESQNFEWQVQAIYYFLKYRKRYYKRRIYEPYFGFGVGQTFYNPTAEITDSEGITTQYNLRDFNTEEQTYGKSTVIIPLSLGLKAVINEFLNLSLDLGYRFTFSGHLDDVYGTYADPDGSGQGYLDGTDEAKLSNRKFEIDKVNQEAFDELIPGKQRGNEKFDGYFLANFNIELYLPRDVFKSKKGRGRKQKIIGKPSAYD